MILNSLVTYYEKLCEIESLPVPGYSNASISYSLNIDEKGELLGIFPEKVSAQRGKKVVEIPKIMRVPEQPKRSGQAPPPYYLSDNGTFVLGIPKRSVMKDEAGRIKEQEKLNTKALEYFERCKKLHLDHLNGIDSRAAIAVRNFFINWDPEKAAENEKILSVFDELSSANLVFRIDSGLYAQQDSDIDLAWQASLNQATDSPKSLCLVTGKADSIARIHPNIKGVRGAQSAGATLVGFNAESFESFGKTQSFNAPVGEYAAFAYTTGLNQLISNPKTHLYVGDTCVVFWSETSEEEYANIFMDCLEMKEDESDLVHAIMQKFQAGNLPDLDQIDFNSRFYILGIAPNAARLSVRFFMQNTFGFFLKNLAEHQQRLEIVLPSYVNSPRTATWNLLNETVNKNSRDKAPSPLLAGALTRAILTNSSYPMALYNGIEIRIKAEQGKDKISWLRAAMIKAFLIKRFDKTENQIKECLTVSLNEKTNNTAYVLGRLFSVLEDIQERANPGIKATIRDRYFNSACATPGMVFPTLIKLASTHLKKIGSSQKGMEVNYNKTLQALMDKLSFEGRYAYPSRLNMEEQGAFQLGYYHQTQKRYEKKDKKENNDD